MEKQRRKVQCLYLILAWGGILSFMLVLLLENTKAASWLVMENNFNWQFSDFFRQIVYASDLQNIYFNTKDAPFPPFAYVLFHLISKMNPMQLPIELKSWRESQNYQYNLLIFVILMIFVSVFLVDIVKKILGFGRISSLFIYSVLLSAPFLSGAIERGNIAILVCVLLLMALFWKEAKEPWKREIALVFIAVAAGLKIYPAIFGLIYLKEKRWGEAARLILYGLMVFFIPFLFTGGLAGFRRYLEVLGSFETLSVARWTNVRCFLLAIQKSLGIESNIQLGIVLENVYLLLCVISFFKTKMKWKHALYLSGILALYIPNSYRYVALYMLIPLVFWFRQSSGRWNDWVYCILFSAVFTIPMHAYPIGGAVDFWIFAPIYLIMAFSMIEVWFMKDLPQGCFMKKKLI